MTPVYYPDVLPKDTAELIPKIRPISRVRFCEETGRAYRLLLRDESLAIDYISDYQKSILVVNDDGTVVMTQKGYPKKRPLTPYHVWALKRIMQRFKDTRSEVLVIYALKHYPEQFSFLTYLETLRNAQKNKQRRQQTRRRCRIVRPCRPA